MKTAFVLAGGGAGGSYQFGCLKAVIEAGITPDFMTANSAGSLNATGLSFGTVEDLEKIWRSIESREDLFASRFLAIPRALFGLKALWNSGPLRTKVEKMIKGNQPKIPYWVNYVDLRDGRLTRAFCSNTRMFVDDVVASASIPIITEPVNGYKVDGGVIENTPLKWAIDEGADRIFVFLNNPRPSKMRVVSNPDNIVDIAVRVLEIMTDEAHWNDLQVCEEYNAEGKGRNIELHYFAPVIRTVGTLDFDKVSISRGISDGYLDTRATLQKKGFIDGVF